jgi:hypothetical protein
LGGVNVPEWTLSATLADKIYINLGGGAVALTHEEWSHFRLWMNILGLLVEKEIEDIGHRDGYTGEPQTIETDHIFGGKDD